MAGNSCPSITITSVFFPSLFFPFPQFFFLFFRFPLLYLSFLYECIPTSVHTDTHTANTHTRNTCTLTCCLQAEVSLILLTGSVPCFSRSDQIMIWDSSLQNHLFCFFTRICISVIKYRVVGCVLDILKFM